MTTPQPRLLIIGAGGFGREVLAWAEDVLKATSSPEWTIGGFLDSNPHALVPFGIDLPIVGDPATYQPQSHDRFVCAIGDPQIKLKVARGIQSRGGQFVNVIHPTAYVGPRCRMGNGNILCPQAMMTCDASLGDFVTLNFRASVAHDAQVGSGCTINGFADVTGGVRIGEGVLLGSHAAITPRAVVEDGARVGAGSVVIRHVKAGQTVLGVPASAGLFRSDD